MTDARVGGLQVDVARIPLPPDLRIGGVQVDVAYVYGGPPAPSGPTVTVWDGVVELDAAMTVWNGASELPAAVEVVL